MMKLTIAALFAIFMGCVALAQTTKPLSPDGKAALHVQGKWVSVNRQTFTMGGERYEGGKWIEISYGRPLLRGREAFPGSGAEYGKATYAGAPVWRAGANLSTRLMTELPLRIAGVAVPAGEYSLFIELQSPSQWILIVSRWAQAQRFNAPITEGLYGAFNYTPEKDVVRVPMKVSVLPYRTEQLTWEFINAGTTGAEMAIRWDKTMAAAPFSFSPSE
jgi:hypothetical protein